MLADHELPEDERCQGDVALSDNARHWQLYDAATPSEKLKLRELWFANPAYASNYV